MLLKSQPVLQNIQHSDNIYSCFKNLLKSEQSKDDQKLKLLALASA